MLADAWRWQRNNPQGYGLDKAPARDGATALAS
jgi:hypothetical protein